MTRLQQLSQPVAIAMWDFSWLLRHHRTGEFEDWDRVLAGLCERGYNAVRIDAFPHLTAEPVVGTPAPEEYLCRKEFRGADTWGNRYSTRIHPRAALLEFLGRCRAHGVAVGLSTWWLGHGIERQDPLAGPDDFVRAWDETLRAIERAGLMDVLLYVDILNEYPRWHGWNWFHEQVRQRDQAAQKPADPDQAHIWQATQTTDSSARRFYRDFASEVLERLDARWPGLGFFASLSYDTQPEAELDLAKFGALDYHVWMAHCPGFFEATGYLDWIHALADDFHFEEFIARRNAYWAEHRDEMIRWMDGQIGAIAEAGRRHGIPCGNTEGWGEINLIDHPFLDWDWVKECGSICVDLALKHGYRFICTSNFTHPQFPGVWNDVAWHRELTNRICGWNAGQTDRPEGL